MKAYLISIVMYFVAIWLVTWIYGDRIVDNGWETDEELVEETSNVEIVLYTLTVACIPIVRLLYVVLILIMATFTEEGIKEWFAKFTDSWY